MSMAICYKVRVKTTVALGDKFLSNDGYKECENGIFYYCGEFQDLHKFVPETEFISVERMGVAHS